MELEQISNIEKITKKLKIKNTARRIAMAKELNEFAKIIIALYKEEKKGIRNT